MPRLRSPLAVIASVTIATSLLIYGSSIAAQACPLTDGNPNLSQTIRTDATDRLGIANRSSGSKQQSLDYTDIAGFGGSSWAIGDRAPLQDPSFSYGCACRSRVFESASSA